MIRVVEAVQTCIACPAQWEAVTDDGEQIRTLLRGGIEEDSP